MTQDINMTIEFYVLCSFLCLRTTEASRKMCSHTLNPLKPSCSSGSGFFVFLLI